MRPHSVASAAALTKASVAAGSTSIKQLRKCMPCPRLDASLASNLQAAFPKTSVGLKSDGRGPDEADPVIR